MHKDDLELLRVERVTITSGEGIEMAQDVPAIVRPLPPLRDHIGKLAMVIKVKDRKTAEYASSLDHVNLIVMDRSDRSLAPAPEVRSSDLLLPELKSALWETKYRDVFLVTMVEERRRVFLPLRMLLLLSELYLFIGAVNSYDDAEIDERPEHVVPMFAQFMLDLGRPVEVGKEPGNELPIVLLGNTAVKVEKEWRIIILDFSDYPPPSLDPAPIADHAIIREPAFLRASRPLRTRTNTCDGVGFRRDCGRANLASMRLLRTGWSIRGRAISRSRPSHQPTQERGRR